MLLAEFVTNNVVNMATGYNPFFFNFGDHPLVPLVLMLGGGVSNQVEAVQTVMDQMKTALEEAQANLTIAQSWAKSQVDCLRRDEKSEVGNEVVLSTRHISVNQHLPPKLWRHWVGPYQVAKVISPVAYGLDLPPAWRIHLVFHVSNLKRFHQSKEFKRKERLPSPIVFDGEEEYMKTRRFSSIRAKELSTYICRAMAAHWFFASFPSADLLSLSGRA